MVVFYISIAFLSILFLRMTYLCCLYFSQPLSLFFLFHNSFHLKIVLILGMLFFEF